LLISRGADVSVLSPYPPGNPVIDKLRSR